MPDIFGLEKNQYSHMAKLEKAGLLDQHMSARSARASAFGRQPHNFNLLKTNASPAEAFGYVTTNLEAIQSMIDEILYTENRLSEMVPLNESVAENAASYLVRILNRAGDGSFIDQQGDSANTARASLQKRAYPIYYGGIDASWTDEDMRLAGHGGFNLSGETIKSAVDGAMYHIQDVAFNGDAERGAQGLTNQPITGDNAVSQEIATKTFAASTGDEIVSEIQKQVTRVLTASEETYGRTRKPELCIYAPIEQADLISNKRLTDVNMSVWDYVKTSNAWTQYTGRPLTLKFLHELSGAAASSNDRMIVVPFDETVWEMAISMMPRATRTVQKEREIVVPVDYRVGVLVVKRPALMHYVDNV